MKLVVQTLPTLIFGVFIAILQAQPLATASLSQAQRITEIKMLRLQQVAIATRLAVLERCPRPFVPRGAGLAAALSTAEPARPSLVYGQAMKQHSW